MLIFVVSRDDFFHLVSSLYMLILKVGTINLWGFEVVAISKRNAASFLKFMLS